MEKHREVETLSHIKQLLERSTKLTSLSGISGIAAGLIAVLGVVIASVYLQKGLFAREHDIMNPGKNAASGDLFFLICLALIIFLAALGAVIYFSSRNAKKKNVIFWDAMAKRVFINLFIFFFTGGMFCLILIYYGIYFLIVPSLLIFYGLALINVSKFTFNEVAQLGIIEICLGILSSFVIVYPLLMWLIGFGVLHLIYGTYVYFKYEKVQV